MLKEVREECVVCPVVHVSMVSNRHTHTDQNMLTEVRYKWFVCPEVHVSMVSNRHTHTDQNVINEVRNERVVCPEVHVSMVSNRHTHTDQNVLNEVGYEHVVCTKVHVSMVWNSHTHTDEDMFNDVCSQLCVQRSMCPGPETDIDTHKASETVKDLQFAVCPKVHVFIVSNRHTQRPQAKLNEDISVGVVCSEVYDSSDLY